MPRHRPHRRAGARRAHALRLSSGASGTDDGEDLRLFEVEIVEETIPDPRIESLPPADYRAMAHVAATLLVNPQGARAEAERLVARYPHIPTIQNHLTLILEECGEQAKADSLIEAIYRRFPEYPFGVVRYVMLLLKRDQLAEARAILEEGPRGPILSILQFMPGTTRFHISEFGAYTTMVGHYLARAGRFKEAQMNLQLLTEVCGPDHPMCRTLEDALTREAVRVALERYKQREEQRERARASKKKSSGKKAAKKPGGNRTPTSTSELKPKESRRKPPGSTSRDQPRDAFPPQSSDAASGTVERTVVDNREQGPLSEKIERAPGSH